MNGDILPFAVFEEPLDRITIKVTIKVTAEDTRIHPIHIPATAPWLRQEVPWEYIHFIIIYVECTSALEIHQLQIMY